VRELTGGHGVDVVYDSVGRDTFFGSLDCLAVRGHLVNFGQSSGSVAPFEVSRLAARSNGVTRPILLHYISGWEVRERMAEGLFDLLAEGVLSVEPGKTYLLSQADAAHTELESRHVPGPLLLIA
jgi:NADPH2:quinone reductase